MKKVIGLLVVMMVFTLGFGAGQYFHDSGLEFPGLAMASSMPTIVSWHPVEFLNPASPHRYGIFVNTDRPPDAVEIKSGVNRNQVAIYYK